MGDYGSAVSQKGYDVKTCADRFLVYSSAFQTLKVFNTYSVSTTIPSIGDNTIPIPHNLGYYAPFIVIYNGSTTTGTNNSYFFSSTKSSFNDIYPKNTINELTIYVGWDFDSSYSNQGDTVYFTVYIFLNDFSTIAENNINTGTTSGSSSTDYGIRISKDGHDVKTAADVNCVLSSSSYSQIIHKVGIFDSSGEVSHNLGYVPTFLTYRKYTSHIEYRSAYVSSSKLYGGEGWYYIIFKQKNE